MTEGTCTPAQSEGRQRHPPIVYLVGDDPSFLRALPHRLQAADYRVEIFGSAEELLMSDRSEAGCVALELQMSGRAVWSCRRRFLLGAKPISWLLICGLQGRASSAPDDLSIKGDARDGGSEHLNGQSGQRPKRDARAGRWIVSRVGIVETVTLVSRGDKICR
jgi:hypothetical protein